MYFALFFIYLALSIAFIADVLRQPSTALALRSDRWKKRSTTPGTRTRRNRVERTDWGGPNRRSETSARKPTWASWVLIRADVDLPADERHGDEQQA